MSVFDRLTILRGVVLTLLLVGVLDQRVSARRQRRRFAPPGRIETFDPPGAGSIR
jgi:hypothetical protein